MLNRNFNKEDYYSEQFPYDKPGTQSKYTELHQAIIEVLLICEASEYKIDHQSIKKIKKFLVSGHNPNITSTPKSWRTPLHDIIQLKLNAEILLKNFPDYLKIVNLVITLLLIYGANPLIKVYAFRSNPYKDSSTINLSALEYARLKKQFDFIDLVDSICNKPEKPLKSIIQSGVFYDPESQEIKTVLKFDSDNLIVYTSIKELDKPLTKKEKDKFLTLFKNTYQPVEQKCVKKANTSETKYIRKRNLTMEEIFEIDFKPNLNKFIEEIYIIQNNKRITIGLHLFELRYRQDYLISFSTHILTDKLYRGLGIASYILFRFGFSLQYINPQKKFGFRLCPLFLEEKIGIFFVAIDFFSFLLAKDLLLFPKYKVKHIESLVKGILADEYGDIQYESDMETMLSRFKETYPIKVRELSEKILSIMLKRDPYIKFFYQHILGIKNNMEDRYSTPVFFNVADENFEIISDVLKKRIGLCFGDSIKQFARSFDKATSGEFYAFPDSRFIDNHSIFWHNKVKFKSRIPDDSHIQKQHFLRSKL